jgi:hypothetical protein
VLGTRSVTANRKRECLEEFVGTLNRKQMPFDCHNVLQKEKNVAAYAINIAS